MAYGDTDSVVDPGSVFLQDIPGYDPGRPTASEQGIMTNSGIRHFLQHLIEEVDNGFVHHRQQNDIMQAIARSLADDPNVIPTRSVAASSWDTGQWANNNAGNAGRIVGRRDKRRSITLINNGGQTVYLDKSPVVNSGESFPLAVGSSVTLTTTAEVWATSTVIPATLAWFETYDA